MSKSAMDADLLSITNQQSLVRVPRAKMRLAVSHAFALKRRTELPISVVMVDDREIRRIHLEFLGKDSATDVISFPLQSPRQKLRPGEMFGELYVSAQTAARVANERGHPVSHELTLYVAHGALHLLGFDDHAPADQARMRRAERQCLAAAGIHRDLFSHSD